MEKSKDIHANRGPRTWRTRGPQETIRVAGEVTKDLWFHREGGALILALSGTMGAGKTQFAKGVASILNITETIASPTFVLMKRYEIPRTVQFKEAHMLYHFDCYRVREAKEIAALGWGEIVANKNNIVIVEWPEKIKELLPKYTVRIAFISYNEEERKIIVHP